MFCEAREPTLGLGGVLGKRAGALGFAKKNRCFLREQFSSKLPGSQNYFGSPEYCMLIFLVTTVSRVPSCQILTESRAKLQVGWGQVGRHVQGAKSEAMLVEPKPA